MWLFEAPKTYTEVCKKVAQAVFYIVLIELFILSQISTDFAAFMKTISFNTQTEIIGIKLYVAYIYVPLILSIIENIFKVHYVIGKKIKLIEIYDGCIIFKAYINALKIDTNLSSTKLYQVFRKNSHLKKLLRDHFYYYVSDTDPKIDSHDIHMALDSLCWVWIFLDIIVISILQCIICTILKLFSWSISKYLIIGLVIYSLILIILLLLLLVTSCKNYSTKEVIAAVKKDTETGQSKKNNELKEIIINALHNK